MRQNKTHPRTNTIPLTCQPAVRAVVDVVYKIGRIGMVNIKVLGTGCPNCHRLEEMCREAVNELQVEAQIEAVTDMEKFMDYGVLLTPALVINNEVKVQGKIPLKPTLVNWIKQAAR